MRVKNSLIQSSCFLIQQAFPGEPSHPIAELQFSGVCAEMALASIFLDFFKSGRAGKFGL